MALAVAREFDAAVPAETISGVPLVTETTKLLPASPSSTAVAVAIMGTMGYVNNSAPDANGNFTAIDVNLLSWEVACDIRMLVAVLYLVAGIFQFIGLGLVYNLDKKTLATMQAELAARREKAEVVE